MEELKKINSSTSKIENLVLPEKKDNPLEEGTLKKENLLEKKGEEGKDGEKVKVSASLSNVTVITHKSPQREAIENILEEGLGVFYEKMTQEDRRLFRLRGESIALEIEQMFKNAKIITNKVWRLILNWLKIIPGVNKFFLEKEAKIRTEKIVLYHKNSKH